MGWIVGCALGIYLVGFLISVPLFLVGYLKKAGRGWIAGIIIAAITTTFLYAVFEVGLGIKLYRGLLPRSLGW
jgi:hypothetical protein